MSLVTLTSWISSKNSWSTVGCPITCCMREKGYTILIPRSLPRPRALRANLCIGACVVPANPAFEPPESWPLRHQPAFHRTEGGHFHVASASFLLMTHRGGAERQKPRLGGLSRSLCRQ
jgi:hypothetical protein